MIREKYEELRNEYVGSVSEEYHIKVDTERMLEIFIGYSAKGNPFFSFALNRMFRARALELKQTSGYSVLPDLSNSENMFWRIEANSEEALSLFYVVVDDLISIAESSSESFGYAIVNQLFKWENFFKISTNGVLSFSQVIGLWGELSFIYDCIELGKTSEVINAWAGPDHSTKDFLFKNNALEIKTSKRNVNNRIHISDENQLDCSGLDKLYLNVRILSQDQMNGKSLPVLIKSITSQITDLTVLKNFNDKLMQVGFREEFEHEYIDKFELRESHYYDVVDDPLYQFPRIIPSDLIAGVKFVTYQIEMSNLQKFELDDDKINNLLEDIVNE